MAGLTGVVGMEISWHLSYKSFQMCVCAHADSVKYTVVCLFASMSFTHLPPLSCLSRGISDTTCQPADRYTSLSSRRCIMNEWVELLSDDGKRGKHRCVANVLQFLSGVAQIWWLENRLQRNISSSAPWINSLLPLQTLKREFSLFFCFLCIVELKYLYSNKLELERPPRLITRSLKKKSPM